MTFASSVRRLPPAWLAPGLPRQPLCAGAAVVIEGIAFALAIAFGLPVSIAVHAVASALSATALRARMPASMVERGRAAWLFFFSGCFFMPLVGMPLMLRVAVIAQRMANKSGIVPFKSYPAPTYGRSSEEAVAQLPSGAVHRPLGDAAAPVEERLRALLAVQAMPARMANPRIRAMLADPSEDLRLIAYGILDSREKSISARIHAATHELSSASSERAILHKQLAELYNELIYQGLVQGDLREHAAQQARAQVDCALALRESDPALHALSGRIALGAGDCAAAERALGRALDLGLAESRVLPYLAEVAFRRGRFDEVQALVRRLGPLANTPRIEQVIAYWRTR